MSGLDLIMDYAAEKYPDYKIIPIDHKDIVFEERIRMNCFYCGKYNSCWKCPPNLPKDLDFKKMFGEFDNIALVYRNFPITSETFSTVRRDSSVALHNTLLDLEGFLWQNNNSTALSFIGGSCKLCKNGCGKDRCNNPYKARTPIEATGVNIVSTIAKYGVEVNFPPEDHITRIGMILW